MSKRPVISSPTNFVHAAHLDLNNVNLIDGTVDSNSRQGLILLGISNVPRFAFDGNGELTEAEAMLESIFNETTLDEMKLQADMISNPSHFRHVVHIDSSCDAEHKLISSPKTFKYFISDVGTVGMPQRPVNTLVC